MELRQLVVIIAFLIMIKDKLDIKLWAHKDRIDDDIFFNFAKFQQ